MIAVYCACLSLTVYLWPGLAALLMYDRQAILEGEFWRLGTACFVHFSASHLLWDLLVFTAAGLVIKVRGHRGFSTVCCLSALTPGIFLLLALPDISRFGGLSGLATGAVVYLSLCEIPEAGRHRFLWLAIMALVGMKIAAETVSRTPIFAGSGSGNFLVLPSVHAIGFIIAIGVYGAMKSGMRLERT